MIALTVFSNKVAKRAVPMDVVTEQQRPWFQQRPDRPELKHHVFVGMQAVVEKHVDVPHLGTDPGQQFAAVAEMYAPARPQMVGNDPTGFTALWQICPDHPAGAGRNRLVGGQINRDQTRIDAVRLCVDLQSLKEARGKQTVKNASLEYKPRLGQSNQRIKKAVVLIPSERLASRALEVVTQQPTEAGVSFEFLTQRLIPRRRLAGNGLQTGNRLPHTIQDRVSRVRREEIGSSHA